MILRQYLHTDPVVAASYLFGCGGHAAGAVVPELATAAGAEYVLHASASVLFPFHSMGDGHVLPLGNVTAQVLHLPGHTPEHLALVVTDRTRGPDPWTWPRSESSASPIPPCGACSSSGRVRSPTAGAASG
jgi:hypothetical protein